MKGLFKKDGETLITKIQIICNLFTNHESFTAKSTQTNTVLTDYYKNIVM
ncbi:hypothetical protein SAMN05216357_10635 [Porphyromonadaceae bacterium KH3CP3RA]|nr:hypothetical protein SAMN05216357_10635 [Porphyromonadaceae bacterium KH3CP3RA]